MKKYYTPPISDTLFEKYQYEELRWGHLHVIEEREHQTGRREESELTLTDNHAMSNASNQKHGNT